ncbi:MAG: hypothetical protein MJB57_09020 [Gemmatimonadetes bacterium]|nr:hypothetical protein [Gemmatimonadota bacterium]
MFIDCRGFRFCDRDFYVREIAFINHTRDREDAQVHVLITGQQTGAGGQRISIDFIGRDEFEGLEDRLGVTAPPAEAIEQVMTQIARQIQLGLARYIARTDQSQVMRLQADEDAPAPEVATPEDDPWNFWTFEVSASGFLFGQERQQFFFGNTDFEARRVTEGSRLELGAGFNYSESNFDTSDTTTVTSITRGYDANVLFVLSAGEHWGWGGQLAAAHSTFSNEDLTIRLAPAIEYNVFPYSESTRRQLRFVYSVGVTRLDYTEETIFFKTEETVPDHRFAAALEVRQPWGSSRASFQVVQHLDDLSRHRINFNGGVDLRVIKGLSLGINGGVSRVRDQINLAALGASEEEILTRQRELETGFEYDFNVRFSYTFGSIFSNVVNPRLGGRNEFFLRNF